MPLVTMRQILDHAAENNYGVPAFNINDMEQIIAVLQAAKKVNAPVILQTSTGARKFAGESTAVITLEGQSVQDLFAMTPHYWNTPADGAARLAECEQIGRASCRERV